MKRKILSIAFAIAVLLMPSYVKAADDSTLQSKINSATAGDTIKLDKDYTESITVRKNITLDLAGFTLNNHSGDENINVISATLTITDSSAKGTGKIVQTGGFNAIQSNVDYEAESISDANQTEGKAKIILEKGTITSDGWGITLFNNSEFVMNGGKIVTTGDETYAICGNGTIVLTSNNYGANTKIEINGGVIESKDYAIYLPQLNGETVINGGEITGEAGSVIINRGKLTINGGTLKSLGTDTVLGSTETEYKSTDWSTNAVIAMPALYTRNYGADEDVIVNIGGKAKLVAEGNAELLSYTIPVNAYNTAKISNAANTTKVTITGGTYSSSVSNYITSEYTMKEVDSSTYVVYKIHGLTVTNPVNGTLSADATTALSGDTVTLTIEPSLGYAIGEIKVLDSKNNVIKVTDNKFTMPDDDVTITVTFTAIVAKFTEGAKEKYNGESMVFKLDGNYALFDKVYINETELSSEHYDAQSGSTIITIKNEYLETLKDGNYTLKVTYTNGTEATTTFAVGDVIEENPKTLDNITMYIGMCLVSVIGLASTGLYLKKKRFN